jgi:hypothetical protein
MTNKCTDCVFSIHKDFGYSNYTVEGTTIHCSKNLNPYLPSDRWYGENPALLFAQYCESFDYGQPVTIDCDIENSFGRDWTPDEKYVYYATDKVSSADIWRVLHD